MEQVNTTHSLTNNPICRNVAKQEKVKMNVLFSQRLKSIPSCIPLLLKNDYETQTVCDGRLNQGRLYREWNFVNVVDFSANTFTFPHVKLFRFEFGYHFCGQLIQNCNLPWHMQLVEFRCLCRYFDKTNIKILQYKQSSNCAMWQ